MKNKKKHSPRKNLQARGLPDKTRKISKSKGPLYSIAALMENDRLMTIIALPVLLIVFVALYSSIFDEKLNLSGDNLQYYYLAKNLSDRGTFALYYDIQQNPHSHFPPGYPLFLSLFMHISDSSLFVKAVNGFLLLNASLILFFSVRKLGYHVPLALTAALAILLNGHLLYFSTIMMSEIPFLFFSLLFLFFTIHTDFSKPALKNPTFLIAIFFLYFSYLTRSQGIALLPGLILFLALTKRWWYIPTGLGAFLMFSLPWTIRNKVNGVSSDYLNQLMRKNPYRIEEGSVDFAGLFMRMGENAQRYFDKEIPTSLFGNLEVIYVGDDFEKWSYWPVGIFLVAVIAIGIFSMKHKKSLLIGYIGGTIGILMLWPQVWYGNRFLMPILPFLLFGFILGIKIIIDYFAKRVFQKQFVGFNPLLILPILFLFNNNAIERLQIESDQAKYPENFERYFELAEWAGQTYADEAPIIACRKPQFFAWFSGLPATSFSRTPDNQKLIEGLQKAGARYVVVDQLGFSDVSRYLVPAIQNHPRIFTIIRETNPPENYFIQINE